MEEGARESCLLVNESVDVIKWCVPGLTTLASIPQTLTTRLERGVTSLRMLGGTVARRRDLLLLYLRPRSPVNHVGLIFHNLNLIGNRKMFRQL